jgi:intracellular multiplication protein IcmW
MPDLSPKAVAQFWKQYEDPMIYRVVTFMESVEDWALDGDSTLEEAIRGLGSQLDDIGKIDLDEMGQQELFIRIANSVKTGRALRLLQAIDTAHPGSASKLLMHAEEVSQRPDDPAGLFLRRNIVFERLRLLARVFSAARFALIIKALEGEDHA